MPKKKTLKKKKGGANASASLSGTSSDIVMGHPEMSEKFNESGGKLPFNENITGDWPKTGIDIEPVDVSTINMKRSMLANKQWGPYYRNRSAGMDELISTSSVRELLSGVLKKNPNPTSKELENIEQFVNIVSDVRFPTKYSGYNYNDGRVMQHPTAKGSAMWASSGKNHGGSDKARRQAVLETLQEHIEKKSSVSTTLKALVVRSITFTLNEFTAPATAKDQKTLTVDDKTRREQVKQRERLKEVAKYLGAEQDSGSDTNIHRDWGDRSKKRSVSPNRFLGPTAEKEVRLATSMGNKNLVHTLANQKAAATTVALTTGATLKTTKMKIKKQPKAKIVALVSNIGTGRPSRKGKFEGKYGK